MRTAITSGLLLSTIATTLLGYSIAGKGENLPVVHSFEHGTHYARSIPSDDYGTTGTTRLYRVTRSGDELIEEFPVYMRGQLYFAWLPLQGEWAVVQVEPVRIRDANDFDKDGKVARLVFHRGGAQIREYQGKALETLGLLKNYDRVPAHVGGFTVQGIHHLPGNIREFRITKRNDVFQEELVRFDVATGELLDLE